MIETKTIKNWLEKDLHFFLKKFFLFEYPHFYGHSSLSSIEGKMFYNSDLNKNDPLSKFLLFKISKTLTKKYPLILKICILMYNILIWRANFIPILVILLFYIC